MFSHLRDHSLIGCFFENKTALPMWEHEHTLVLAQDAVWQLIVNDQVLYHTSGIIALWSVNPVWCSVACGLLHELLYRRPRLVISRDIHIISFYIELGQFLSRITSLFLPKLCAKLPDVLPISDLLFQFTHLYFSLPWLKF